MNAKEKERFRWRFAGQIIGVGISAEFAVSHAERLIDALEASADPYEYQITRGGRKVWDGSPDLSKEGWEEYKEWNRFEYHEERYWKRLK